MRKRSTYATVAIAAMVIAALLLAISIGVKAYASPRTTVTTVTHKERVCSFSSKGGSCKYLVYTEETTFRVQDSILAWRWNSSDFYGKIKVCHRYRLTYYGIRFGLGSHYPNLTGAKDEGHVEGCTDS